MRCEKCGNRIKELFIYKGNEYVCRRCLVYKDEEKMEYALKGKGDYKLKYELTVMQKKASEFILNCIKDKKDCILSAVTGAGKTEIIYPLLRYCIENKMRVAIAIPRRDVVIELYNRITNDFKLSKVICVYGGNNENIYGDIVIATTHQLYRYSEYFDVVVIDEVDAFPFYKNELLNNFLKRCKKGNIVYMSATVPGDLLKEEYPVFYLNKRYHNQKLPVPVVKTFFANRVIKKYINKYRDSILIIYFPTIKQQLKFHKNLKQKHYLINSKVQERKEILDKLHKENSAIVLSTLVLERGVTFKNTNVIVVNADHNLFSASNLIQIAGRVGRHHLYTKGDVIFLVKNKTKSIKDTINFINKCNE